MGLRFFITQILLLLSYYFFHLLGCKKTRIILAVVWDRSDRHSVSSRCSGGSFCRYFVRYFCPHCTYGLQLIFLTLIPHQTFFRLLHRMQRQSPLLRHQNLSCFSHGHPNQRVAHARKTGNLLARNAEKQLPNFFGPFPRCGHAETSLFGGGISGKIEGNCSFEFFCFVPI